MATRAQKVRLSIFLIVSGSMLLLLFLILVGNRVFRNMETYYIEYRDISVTGLEPGAAVKYHGVQIGRVTGLSVADVATVRVEIEVKTGTPIKQDTEAVITLAGITGLKFIELVGGSETSEPLPPGGTLVAGRSVLDTISGQAEIMIAKAEQLLVNLNDMFDEETAQSLKRALTETANVAAQVDTFMVENRTQITDSIARMNHILEDVEHTTANLNMTVAYIDTLVRSENVVSTIEDVSGIAETLRADIDSLRLAETMSGVRELVDNSNDMVINYDLLALRSRDDILRALRNLEEALDNLREATDMIRDNPSVLIRGRSTGGDLIE